MCGRFTQKSNSEQIEKEFNVSIPQDILIKPRYNIAPTQLITAIRTVEGIRDCTKLKWGLIPSWAKDASFAAKLINARAETLSEKPSFRDAFKKRRCLIPASGFYEWEKTTSGKQPHYFYLKDKEVFGFAGLWEEWLDKDSGELVESCTIITTEANAVLEPIHERMPVIIEAENYDKWLDRDKTDPNELQDFLMPYQAEEMDSYKVSRAVNKTSTDSPDLIAPFNS